MIFVGIFKRTLRPTFKNHFPDGGRQSVCHLLARKSHDATQIDQKLLTHLGHTLPPIQWSRIGSESSSEAMISLDAHHAAADYPMIVSTL
jgi:hypothetical protein